MKITLLTILVSFMFQLNCQTYEQTKTKFQTLKKSITNNHTISMLDAWQNTFLDSLIPYWYGTEWDFNGTSAQPKEGMIACGYFVSTTLLHSGFNLNRYRIAQQDALTISRLCVGKTDYKFIQTNFNDFCKSIHTIKDGLYIAGLSNHVGFIFKEGENIYFIHSNPYGKTYVLKELIENSIALKYTDLIYLSRFDEVDIQKNWLNSNRISLSN